MNSKILYIFKRDFNRISLYALIGFTVIIITCNYYFNQ